MKAKALASEIGEKHGVGDEEIFKEFCQNRDLAPKTVENYGRTLQYYSDFIGKSLEELLDEAEEEEDLGIRYRKRSIKKYLNDFKMHLQDKGYTDGYLQNMMVSVKAFYNEFDIQLPRPKHKKSRMNRKKETIGDLPTISDVRKFMDHCNNCYKAIITISVSSGMSRAELASITFNHLYDAVGLDKEPRDISELIEKLEEKGNIIPKWKIKRVKTGHPYFTFSSSESIHYIIHYLEDLQRIHSDYIPKPEDGLFRSLYHNKPNRAITGKNIGNIFFYVNHTKGFKMVENRYLIRPHSLRKLFATTLEKNKVPHLTTRWLLGHTIDKTTEAYFKADPESLREDYISVVNELSTIDYEVKTIESPEFKELKDNYEKDAKAKSEEIEKLKEENEITRKIVEDFIKNMKDE